MTVEAQGRRSRRSSRLDTGCRVLLVADADGLSVEARAAVNGDLASCHPRPLPCTGQAVELRNPVRARCAAGRSSSRPLRVRGHRGSPGVTEQCTGRCAVTGGGCAQELADRLLHSSSVRRRPAAAGQNQRQGEQQARSQRPSHGNIIGAPARRMRCKFGTVASRRESRGPRPRDRPARRAPRVAPAGGARDAVVRAGRVDADGRPLAHEAHGGAHAHDHGPGRHRAS